MNSEKENKPAVRHHDPEWKGYTIDELRYQKAFALARVEIQKEKMAIAASQLKEGMPGVKAHGIYGKLLGSLNYLDYVIIAYKLSSKVFSMFKSVRHRK